MPKLGPWVEELERRLEANAKKERKDRLSLLRIHEDLASLGYEGGHDAVRRYARAWRRRRRLLSPAQAFVPLSFDPGEAYQFDRSHEYAVLSGATTRVKAAHMRLCHSRVRLVQIFPRESQEMVFEAHERPFLMAYRGPFDGFHASEASVSKTCPVRFDNNRYSVAAGAVGRPVDVRACADRIVIRQDGEIVAEHPRGFGRGRFAYDPWHYVPVLTKKPGALRNGAPIKGWQLPNALGRLRTRLSAHDDGDRQFVKVLAAVLKDGLEAVEAACAEALACGACSADVVLNILPRRLAIVDTIDLRNLATDCGPEPARLMGGHARRLQSPPSRRRCLCGLAPGTGSARRW